MLVFHEWNKIGIAFDVDCFSTMCALCLQLPNGGHLSCAACPRPFKRMVRQQYPHGISLLIGTGAIPQPHCARKTGNEHEPCPE